MDTQVLPVDRSGPQRRLSQPGPVYTPHPSTPQGYPLGRPYPDSVQPVVPVRAPLPQQPPQAPQVRPEPVFSGHPVRSVEERHGAFLKAQEALHDRHYEDNNLRLQAEIALAEFFLS
jgi:hypothetical protein